MTFVARSVRYGSIADVQGMKIKFFLGFFGTGVVTCCAMALPLTWLPFLVVYILATIGLNGSLTFYDSMLIDTTSNERMDKVSSHGYGWKMIGDIETLMRICRKCSI